MQTTLVGKENNSEIEKIMSVKKCSCEFRCMVFFRQPQTVDIVTRRSLIGSVEDDPFVSAHYGTQDKKKARGKIF